MTKETDDELRDWMADWQADPEPAPEIRDAIRQRVQRKSLRMALAATGEIVFALVMLAFVVWSALREPTFVHVVAMACLALLILWATGYSLWYLRGTWRPSAETTSAFIDLSLLRCHRRLRSVRAGWWLLVLELAVMIPWIVFSLKAKTAGFGLLAVLTALVSVFLIVGERRTRRELSEWEEMKGSLGFED
jgi:Na+/melibiose symporter-like transporter